MDKEKVDPEIKEFLELEQQKAQIQGQIHQLTETCWDVCMPDRVKDRMESRAETCLSNCVERFFDVSLLITSRFQQMLQRSVQQ